MQSSALPLRAKAAGAALPPPLPCVAASTALRVACCSPGLVTLRTLLSRPTPSPFALHTHPHSATQPPRHKLEHPIPHVQGSQFSLGEVEVVTAAVDLDEVVSYRGAGESTSFFQVVGCVFERSCLCLEKCNTGSPLHSQECNFALGVRCTRVPCPPSHSMSHGEFC
jgi:hypothetical protein